MGKDMRASNADTGETGGIKVIRVLHVIGKMNHGGAEIMIMNYYRNIDRSVVQFDFVETSLEKAAFDDEILSLGGRIYNCPFFNGLNYIEFKKWWNKFFEEHAEEYHIVHGHIGSSASIYLSIAKKYGLYAIAHSHDTSISRSNFLYSITFRCLSYRTRYIADYFFGCSKAAIIDRFGEKTANGEKSKVLPVAIDVDRFVYNEKIRLEIRKELGLESAFVIGHVGRFVPVKNHAFLLEVFDQFLKLHKEAKLLLIGDGETRSKIEAKAKYMGIFDACIFLGICNNVNEIIQAMDIMVFPSIYEGLGITLIEAQASGLPCIISQGVPEESMVVKQICKRVSLEDPVLKWVQEVGNSMNIEREAHKEEIVSAGYDIKEMAKWLQKFYCKHTC